MKEVMSKRRQRGKGRKRWRRRYPEILEIQIINSEDVKSW